LRNGDYAGALELARSKKEIAPKKLAVLEAEALIESGKGAEALQALEAAEGPRVPILRARLLIARGDLDGAEKLLVLDSGLEAFLLQAQIEGRRKRLDVAARMFGEAIERARAAKDTYREAAAVNGGGMVLLSQARYDDAIPRFEEAMKLYRAAGAKHWVAVASNNAGICYSQLGDFEKAQQMREEALAVAQPGLLRANALGETGTTYLLQGQAVKAAPYYRQARDLAQSLGVTADAARWASNLTAALVTLEDWDGAEKALQSALSFKPEQRSLVFLDLNAAAIALGRGRLEEARGRYEKILEAHPEQVTVLWQAEAGVANSFVAESRFDEARKHFEAALGHIESGRQDLNQAEHRLTFLARLIRVYQDYVEFLVAQGDAAKALEIAESSRARLLAERTAKAYAGKGKRLELGRASGAVWLDYWVAPKRSFLWIVDAGKMRMVELPGAAEMGKLVEEYRGFVETSMRDPMQTESAAGKRLYEVLVSPAAKELGVRRAAIVVPDGALHQLSFETLPNYGVSPWRYWNDEVTAAVAPALSDAASVSRGLAKGASALLVGDPEAAGAEYPRLAEAGKELDGIAALWNGARVVRDLQATPDAWKELPLETFRVIHVAAHAEANRQRPLDSAIILSRGEHGNFRVFAKDVLGKALSAELVTLSACKSSGARTYAGEGQVGLAWAFLGAGAKAAVAGLWDVPDTSTRILMESFYEGLAKGKGVAVALREARAAVRAKGFVKPFYWGPFQAYLR
jgi:tetratricopeptide (TPR) repeat protein